MASHQDAFFRKAEENLAAAESEFVNGRFNSCANRCYQAAIAALTRAGIRAGGDGKWSHGAVQAQFAGQLVNRRKLYPADLRDTLSQNMILRRTADYRPDDVSEIQAARALRRSRAFIESVRPRGGDLS